MKAKILVSACLLGERVRYDGRIKSIYAPILERWHVENRLIVLCPEVAGGLPVPRLPSELQDGWVMNIQGVDVSDAFIKGAHAALALCEKHDVRMAVLKEGSPSCGVNQVNDGSFKGRKIAGSGLTTQLLRAQGIAVFSEHQLQQAEAYDASFSEA